MKADRWLSGLVSAAGLLLTLTLQAWEARYWHPPFLPWELGLVALTSCLATLLLWRVLSAVLAVWSDLSAVSARRADALTYLPLLLMAGPLAVLRWGVPSRGAWLAVGVVSFFGAAKAWLFWRRRPRGLPVRAVVRRAREALWAGVAAAHHPLGFVVAFLILVDVRLVHLAADPPVDLGPSGGAWTDPGEYAHNARNKVLFGQWVWDEVNFMYVSPVINLCFYVVFLVLGVGYAQVGLVSVIFGLATLALFHLSLREAMGPGGARVATLFLGGSYFFVMYNRIGLVETTAVFFQVLTLYFGQRGTRDVRSFFLAGATSLLVLAVKMQMVYIVLAALLSVLLWGLRWPDRPGGGRRSLLPLAYFLGGAAVALVGLAVLWIVPSREQILWRLGNEWRLHSLPMTFSRLFRNVFYNPFFDYFLGSPVLLILSGLAFCHIVLRLIRGRGPVPFAYLFAVWWFVGGFSYLAISQYRPLRYYVSLIPPMAILAGSATLGLWRGRVGRTSSPWSVWVYGGGLFLVGLTGVGYAYARLATVQKTLTTLSLYPLTEGELAVLTAALALVLSAVAYRFLGPWLPRVLDRLPGGVSRWAAGVLVVAFLVAEGRSYLDWNLHREAKLASISRRLGALLPEGSVIAGIFAPALTLSNRHRSLAIWDRYGNWEGDPLSRFGVTHVAAMTYIDEIGYYRRRFPDTMARARLLDEWSLWRTRVLLYELPRPGPASP